MAANPIDSPQSFDVVKIDGVENPGIIAPGGITGFERKSEFDIKKGKGTKGGTVTLTNLPWNAFHFEAWDAIYRARFKFDPTKTKKQAVDIFHPSLKKLDISSVVTKSIGPEMPEGKGLWSITVDLIEFIPPPPKNITNTPTGSTSKGGQAGASGKSDDPIADAQQAEIAKLLREARGEDRPDRDR
jgi:hypothetical protein